ncbi:MAG TPA: extracellular solute-binding protein [Firmicutes bacterium]|nr:extracellular solute-binding protein [Bacillota bacterium]
MRKTSLVLLCLFLLCSLATAKTTLNVWVTGHSNEILSVMKEVIDSKFSPQFDVDVVLTGLSWADNESKYLLAAASNDVPDVGSAGALFLPELGLRGALVDLRTMPGIDEVITRASPGFYRSLTYENAIFGIPYYSSVTLAYYRDDILQDLGLGEIDTWEDLRRVLPKMQARGSNFALEWYLTNTVYSDINAFMWQNGGDDYTPDLSRSGYDLPGSIKGFKEFCELYTKYNIANELPQFIGFTTGEIAILSSSQGMYANLNNAAPQLKGKWSLRPYIGTMYQGELNRSATGTGWSLGLFKGSKNKELGWEFIKWFTSEEIQSEIANKVMERIQGSFFLPAHLESITKLPLPENDLQTLISQLKVSKASLFGLVSPNNRRRYLQFAAQEAILQGVDPEVAIRKYAAEHNVEIKRKQNEYKRFIEKLRKN